MLSTAHLQAYQGKLIFLLIFAFLFLLFLHILASKTHQLIFFYFSFNFYSHLLFLLFSFRCSLINIHVFWPWILKLPPAELDERWNSSSSVSLCEAIMLVIPTCGLHIYISTYLVHIHTICTVRYIIYFNLP